MTQDILHIVLQMARLEPIHIHAVIATAIYTGARRGEIAGLKWEDVDFENRTMYIRRSVVKLVGQEPEIKLPKTISSIRLMAIPQALCDILLELKKEQDRKKALLGEKWHETGFLFTDWCGHVMHPHTPTKQFDKFLKKYGFRHLKFHGLRHSSATYLLSNGCDIKTVSKRLGHTSIDTTNIYVHALAKTDKAAADCFDSSSFRLFLGDIGMFSYQSGINAASFVSNERENTLSGIFFENFIAGELVAKGNPLFYWKGKASSELEFIIESNNKLFPIDVKKGRGVLNSLEKFSNHNKYECAIKISSGNYGYDESKKLLTVPFYFASFVANDLAQGTFSI